MLKILEKTANYAYDWKCEFNDVEFLEMNFRSSEWSPVHDAVTQLSLSQRIIIYGQPRVDCTLGMYDPLVVTFSIRLV